MAADRSSRAVGLAVVRRRYLWAGWEVARATEPAIARRRYIRAPGNVARERVGRLRLGRHLRPQRRPDLLQCYCAALQGDGDPLQLGGLVLGLLQGLPRPLSEAFFGLRGAAHVLGGLLLFGPGLLGHDQPIVSPD